RKKNGYYSFQDSLIGMGTMIIAQCVNVAVSVAIIHLYGMVYEKFALTHLEPTLMNYVLCYIGSDILFYWFHRAGHRINFLWAAHATHHSAEELNYAVALRTSFTQRAASFLFYWPLAVMGFSPQMIIPVVAANLVFQFLPHTRVIGKLPGWIDFWLNTPYQHQVHHGANRVYWDKNYGGTFILWDRLFGTYQDQTEEVYYGITIHPESWDPTWLNFHWFLVLWKDMKAATHFSDKIKIWFMPPGWRPRNLPPYEKKNPHTDARNQVKYRTKALSGSTGYLMTQLVFSMAILQLVINDRSPFSGAERVLVSILLWVAVTVWAAILESKTWAKAAELARIALSFTCINILFNLHGMSPAWGTGLAAISLFSALWVLFRLGAPEKQLVSA
ncbi:MAG: fatty acid hydroxylase family protein, partial [Proteobacteria bacterium]|nr:fatty acid hydroxylase family protein [Pseudomonadota bacterium]